jgi:hypothetical protein
LEIGFGDPNPADLTVGFDGPPFHAERTILDRDDDAKMPPRFGTDSRDVRFPKEWDRYPAVARWAEEEAPDDASSPPSDGNETAQRPAEFELQRNAQNTDASSPRFDEYVADTAADFALDPSLSDDADLESIGEPPAEKPEEDEADDEKSLAEMACSSLSGDTVAGEDSEYEYVYEYEYVDDDSADHSSSARPESEGRG